MTSREPKAGDKVIVDGVPGYISYVSSMGHGIDVEDLEGGYLRSYDTEDYDKIVYVDESIDVLKNVSHPAHYAHPSGVEVIEITKHESFLRGNIIKYVLRAPYKGNELEDMQKAAQYLSWEIERLQETASE